MARFMECVLTRPVSTKYGTYAAGLEVHADLDVAAPAGLVECVMGAVVSAAGRHEQRWMVPDSALQLGGEVAA